MPLHVAVRLLLPSHDGVSGCCEQRLVQLRRVTAVFRVEIVLEVLVGTLLREALAEGCHGAGGEDAVVVHDAEEVVSQLDVEGFLEGRLHEGGVQVGLAAEAEREVMEAVVVFGAHVVAYLVGEGEPPLFELFLGVVGLLYRKFIEFVAEKLVGHEEAEKLVDAGVLAEFGAVLVKRGRDDLRDETAVGADVLEEDVIVIKGEGEGVVLESGEGLIGGVVEDAAARGGVGWHASEGLHLHLVEHAGPLHGEEMTPDLFVAAHHLAQVGSVEFGAGLFEAGTQLLERLEVLFVQAGVVALFFQGIFDFILEGAEIHIEDRGDGKQFRVGLDDIDGGVDVEDHALDFYQETMGIGFAALGGGVKGAAHGEVEHQGLDPFLQGVGFVCVHGRFFN